MQPYQNEILNLDNQIQNIADELIVNGFKPALYSKMQELIQQRAVLLKKREANPVSFLDHALTVVLITAVGSIVYFWITVMLKF